VPNFSQDSGDLEACEANLLRVDWNMFHVEHCIRNFPASQSEFEVVGTADTVQFPKRLPLEVLRMILPRNKMIN
jgi:hypothetical protein